MKWKFKIIQHIQVHKKRKTHKAQKHDFSAFWLRFFFFKFIFIAIIPVIIFPFHKILFCVCVGKMENHLPETFKKKKRKKKSNTAEKSKQRSLEMLIQREWGLEEGEGVVEKFFTNKLIFLEFFRISHWTVFKSYFNMFERQQSLLQRFFVFFLVRLLFSLVFFFFRTLCSSFPWLYLDSISLSPGRICGRLLTHSAAGGRKKKNWEVLI